MSSESDARVGLTYRDAGVDIDAGNALVDRIKPIARATARPEVLGNLGGFGACMAIPEGYREPVLVSTTDGVGTKLKLALQYKRHEGVGIDLVAMCVNDLVVCGAEPLFFLDYFATGKLNVDRAETVIAGIGRGCELAGCALVGGETAEMPGMYQGEDYDLAGFCTGVVERSRMIDGSQVRAGDVLIALGSSGPHSNGYSLIRRILDQQDTDPSTLTVDGQPLLDVLLAPTRIYVRALLKLAGAGLLKAAAHITGGGLQENLPRVYGDGLQAIVKTGSWRRPAVFDWLQQAGNIAHDELHRTFNCGVGMVLVVSEEQAEAALTALQESGENAWICGSIRNRAADAARVLLAE